jgi:hypothetical protein
MQALSAMRDSQYCDLPQGNMYPRLDIYGLPILRNTIACALYVGWLQQSPATAVTALKCMNGLWRLATAFATPTGHPTADMGCAALCAKRLLLFV